MVAPPAGVTTLPSAFIRYSAPPGAGTEAAALIVPSLAASLTAVLDQRKLLAGRIEELLEDHPLSKVLTSMPGVGVRTGARILIEVGDGSTLPPPATSPPTPDSPRPTTS